MVRDLLEGFVREEWLAQLDYASLETVNATYVSATLRERSNDIVWRARRLRAPSPLAPMTAVIDCAPRLTGRPPRFESQGYRLVN